MPRATVGLAVFGAGRIGAVHAKNAASLSHASLVGIADVDAEAAGRIAKQVGKGRVDSVAALLADPDVCGVVIATPTATHARLIEEAAEAGKHILCEKPIALEIGAARNAIAAAQRANVALQVGFQRRFDAEFRLARNSVQSGLIGTARFLRLVGRDHDMPPAAYLQSSGGQYRDQMIHEFDLARWLFAPALVEEVYATGSAIIDPAIRRFNDIDTAVAVLRYDTGALGVIDGSREAIYGYDVRAELQGSKGMLLIGNERLPNGRVIGSNAATPSTDSFIERFAQAYAAELGDFVDAIGSGRKPLVDGDDDVEALRLALAATRSFHERRPVKVSEIADD